MDYARERLGFEDRKTWSLLQIARRFMCAEILCTYATTAPFDPDKEDEGGFVRSIAERDGWRCARPGCRSRTALQGDHVIPRSQGGSDDDDNKITLCAVCHRAKTTGILKVSGCAPDGLTWEGPFGVIEKPLPLPSPANGTCGSLAREGRTTYGGGRPPEDTGARVSLDARSCDQVKEVLEAGSDHVISEVEVPPLKEKIPRAFATPYGAPEHRFRLPPNNVGQAAPG